MPRLAAVLPLLCLCLGVGVLAAPLPGNPEFLQNNLEFSRKIASEAEELRDMMCERHRLCKAEELTLIREQLGLHVTSLDQCHSDTFSLEGCFSQVRSGLRDFRSLALTLPAGTALTLRMDIGDLLTNVQEEMESRGINPLNYPSHGVTVPKYPSTFHEQAGAFLILSDLQNFMRRVQRALTLLQRM
ncbi:granulocyte colony-stimulating factor [Ascaphus truei]|uniref:granulocyte colony-stimulating factor n=1 Tax=Ascaphus truei TaxID=8439 RepID=UPI003F5A3538